MDGKRKRTKIDLPPEQAIDGQAIDLAPPLSTGGRRLLEDAVRFRPIAEAQLGLSP